ncbi:MAG: hypothetical protein A3G91_02095 [Omnitrophica WOR_2 bacterium RIFCSPLOWO2_12_FULL_50_9]|nr:MAG: hypothetical protein A3G91_02095 [Omnitrophica WOR_2 bacterium RIFCSPLOWO2_12_FULL_50_9]
MGKSKNSEQRQCQPVVLMYHGIVSRTSASPPEREAGAGFYDVTAENFRAQMEYLKTNGCTAQRDVILTFDDGEMNNFEEALPMLKEFGFTGYFFIIAQRVGRQGYMGWEELRALHEAGMVIGSHGFSHEILTNLQDTQIQEELAASKKYLERNLEIAVESLSVPRGFCNDKILQMAYKAGYKSIFISERPAGFKSACLSRIAVKSHWLLRRFIQAMDGRTPAGERIFEFSKNGFKQIGGGALYDWMRRMMLKIK